MAGLTGKVIGDNYKSLLRINDDINGVDSSLENVTDGGGTSSALALSDDKLIVQPQNDDTTTAFEVKAKGGASLLSVDTTNSIVKAGVGAINVLNQYAFFGVNNTDTANFLDDTWHALPFNNTGYGDISYPPAFGTSINPATSFTIVISGNGTKASDIVPCLWYVTDDITIDSVKHLFGADTATGDLNQPILASFTFNSGAAGCLTAYQEHVSISAINSGGGEVALLTTWNSPTASDDGADVDAGRVICLLVKGQSIDSDNSWSVIVKYHLR